MFDTRTRCMIPRLAPRTIPKRLPRKRKLVRVASINAKADKLPRRAGPSKLEARFSLLWRAVSGPALESEYRFHPVRKWRADFAHHASRTLIEIEGGIWGGGRHNTGAGMSADMEKYLEAALCGWRVIRLCDKQLSLETIQRVLGYVRGGEPQGGGHEYHDAPLIPLPGAL